MEIAICIIMTKGSDVDSTTELFNCDLEDEKDTILSQWKVYVEMADKISQRRAIANSFFLVFNSILVGAIGLTIENKLYFLGIPFLILGIFGSLTWYFLIKSYKKLNGAKFWIINAIEEKLPIRGYKKEWEKLEEGKSKSKYWKLTELESARPIFICLTYVILFLLVLLFIFGILS